MNYPGFSTFGSSPSQSVLADGERCQNWFPEPVESPAAPYKMVLYPAPGFQSWATVTDVNTRGLFGMGGRAWANVGTGLYELFSTSAWIKRGTIAENNNPASIASNGIAGNQLVFASGQNANLIDLTTNTVTTVPITGEATMIGMIDGYFLAFNVLTNRYRISNLNNGLIWDANQFLARSIAPDPWQAMIVDGNRQIWLIGEQTGEVHYNAGSFPFPFAPIPGAVFGYGTRAPFSVKVVGDSVMWLSRTVDGAGIVVSARGYSPQRVSTHAVETLIAGYARQTTIDDAEAVTYQDQGHTFYALSFPSVPATLVYDKTTNIWSERGKWNSVLNRYDVWAPRVHAYAFGKHLVGDRTTGVIAEMDVTFPSEADGTAIRRLRIPPPLVLADGHGRLFVSRFEVMLEPGLGTSTGQAFNPRVMLRVSQNGKTWSNQRTASAGKMGEVDARVFWTRLGSSTNLWVPEVTVSDPVVGWRILGADLEGSGFSGAQQRAA